MVEGSGPENRRAETLRGFESLTSRQVPSGTSFQGLQARPRSIISIKCGARLPWVCTVTQAGLYAEIAQLAERVASNHQAAGSNPVFSSR